MVEVWDALLWALLGVGWPGLLAVSAYAILRSIHFYRAVRRSPPGLLVLLTVVGWVSTLAGVALVSTFYLITNPAQAVPVVLPIFLLWGGSMVVIVYVVQKWGHEAVALDAYYGELETMDRVKTRFINHIAHELNTPITPLQMQVHLLESGRLGEMRERQAKAVGVISRNLGRLRYLVEMVILASRLQAGKVDLRTRQVDLEAVVRQSAPDGMELRWKAAPGILVEADESYAGFIVQQVLRYADRQGASWVEVEAYPARDRVIAHFRFPGKDGIAANLFEAFAEPAELDRTEQYVGLEMFIARGLAEAQRGHLRNRSSDGLEILELDLPVPGPDMPGPN